MPRAPRSHAQLDLFAPAEANPSLEPVAAAEVDATVTALVAQLPPHLYLGTSSWTFPGWAGLVYDRVVSSSQLARHGLTAYARHPLLRSVGIDRTYYAPMKAADLRTYADAVPDDFRFLVKAHELCTLGYFRRSGRYAERHGERNAHFLDPVYTSEAVVGPCIAGLGTKLGLILLQFPPQDISVLGGAERFAECLHGFLRALPSGVLYAIELRNAALLTPAYGAVLRETGACHCYNVHPTMPAIPVQRQRLPLVPTPALVVRWMLHPTQHYEAARRRYEPFNCLVDEDPETRQAIATLCTATLDGGKPAFVIANNKAEGSSPLTLIRLAACLARQAVEE